MVCLLSSLFIVVVLYHICLVVCFLSSLLGYWFVSYNLCCLVAGMTEKVAMMLMMFETIIMTVMLNP